ncbi:putative sporulation protein YtxC [Bacillus suaedaesalsae]|uniref:Sporulation protein YtxC n=1 Tax=Bacillus suaedaesalsae TaxID=2810349 RepID=A0ABS2DGA5_9BACI|nr:putative sporulation protein YtxC [Bacillus suaedaesalsae]MBM6617509.1 putative sporulation protein YtxC [Bacillus suaedaesalsae]
MHITFDTELDLQYVYKLLSNSKNQSLKLKMKDATLFIDVLKNDEECIRTYIIPALTQFVLKIKEPQYIRYFLSTMFFYEDETEQLQIIEMVQSLVSDDEERLHPSLKEGYPREEIIKRALSMFLTKQVQFSFEAFLTFRLKDYLLRLQEYIEVAIDEYKLEQDYQDFIETLRKYIACKTSHINLIHVVQEKERFIFYDEMFTELEVKVELEEEFVSNYGFEVDQELIAPLLLLSPASIHLYSANLDHGIVQTVVSIFQERVTIFPYERFLEKYPIDHT